MAFENIAVRQAPSTVVSADDATVTLSITVAAGSTLILIGGAVNGVTYQTSLLNSATYGANAFGTPVNLRTGSQYLANVFVAVAENVSAGTYTVTGNFSQSSNNKVSMACIEIEKPVTSSGTTTPVTGAGTAGATSTSTSSTGALAQTDNIIVGCAAGPFGTPVNPAGYSSVLTQANGTYLGCQISYKKVTATDAVTFTVDHESGGTPGAIALAVLAATAGGTKQYKFLLDATAFTSSDTGITGYVWRNGAPDNVLAEKYTGLEGDAVAGTLIITGVPAAAETTDTVIGSFYNGTDGSAPFVSGAVEEA